RLSGPRRRPLPALGWPPLIRLYSDPAHLVLVVKREARTRPRFTPSTSSAPASLPRAPPVSPAPRALTSEQSRRLRAPALQRRRRVFFASSAQIFWSTFALGGVGRCCLLDRLTRHMRPSFSVCYREANPTGFIKAITDRPRAHPGAASASTESCHPVRASCSCCPGSMKPAACMDACPPQQTVVSIFTGGGGSRQPDEPMLRCQSALVDLLNLHAGARSLRPQNALTRGLRPAVAVVHGPGVAPHELPSRQLVADIRTLRRFLLALTQEDPAAFHRRVASVISSEKAFAPTPAGCSWPRPTAAGRQQGPAWAPARPRGAPKWLSCRAILQELSQSQFHPLALHPTAQQQQLRTLIIVHGLVYSAPAAPSSPRAPRRLPSPRMPTPRRLRDEDAVETNDNGDDFDGVEKVVKENKRPKEEEQKPNLLTLTQMIRPASDVNDQPQQQGDDVESVDKVDQAHVGNCGRVRIEAAIPVGAAVRPVRLSSRDVAVRRQAVAAAGSAPPARTPRWGTSRRCRCCWTAVRPPHGCCCTTRTPPASGSWRCTACARGPGRCPLVVLLLRVRGSVEEAALPHPCAKEKEAFEFLIPSVPCDERAVVKGDLAPGTNWPGPDDGIAAAAAEQHQLDGLEVIVDVREFRSEPALPAAQARHQPFLTGGRIDVGDYVLTPDICDRTEIRERSDWLLNSGRLYNQVVNMTQHYRTPVLLIEFDAERTGFALYHGRAAMSSELNSSDTISRLSLLTLHFPQLRILWSPPPHASAELFHDLKRGRPQPQLQLLPQSRPPPPSNPTTTEASSSTSLTPAASAATLRHVCGACCWRMPGVTHPSLRGLIKAAGGSFAGLWPGWARRAAGGPSGSGRPPTGCTNFCAPTAGAWRAAPLLAGRRQAARNWRWRQTADAPGGTDVSLSRKLCYAVKMALGILEQPAAFCRCLSSYPVQRQQLALDPPDQPRRSPSSPPRRGVRSRSPERLVGTAGLRKFVGEHHPQAKEARLWLKYFKYFSAKSPGRAFAVMRLSPDVFADTRELRRGCLVHRLPVSSTGWLSALICRMSATRNWQRAELLGQLLLRHGVPRRCWLNERPVERLGVRQQGADLLSLSQVCVPIVCCPVLASDAGDEAASAAVVDFRSDAPVRSPPPAEVLLLSGQPGLPDPKGRVMSDLAPLTGPRSHLNAEQRRQLLTSAELLGNLSSESHVVLTSAGCVVQELFTHHGSGTMVRTSEKIIQQCTLKASPGRPCPHCSTGVREDAARRLVHPGGGPGRVRVLQRELQCRRGGSATAKTFGCPTWTRLHEAAQGSGIAVMLWNRIMEDYPRLFWRAKCTNKAAVAWYNTLAQGS
uniref:ERCC4 domain-containing protein n=1 Tax=Macrostomum lignano TaxID=282301 RepID=A0A1I8FN50_9PLAT